MLKKTETADGGLNYDLSVKGAVDPRVDQLNEEIGRVGAQRCSIVRIETYAIRSIGTNSNHGWLW